MVEPLDIEETSTGVELTAAGETSAVEDTSLVEVLTVEEEASLEIEPVDEYVESCDSLICD